MRTGLPPATGAVQIVERRAEEPPRSSSLSTHATRVPSGEMTAEEYVLTWRCASRTEETEGGDCGRAATAERKKANEDTARILSLNMIPGVYDGRDVPSAEVPRVSFRGAPPLPMSSRAQRGIYPRDFLLRRCVSRSRLRDEESTPMGTATGADPSLRS